MLRDENLKKAKRAQGAKSFADAQEKRWGGKKGQQDFLGGSDVFITGIIPRCLDERKGRKKTGALNRLDGGENRHPQATGGDYGRAWLRPRNQRKQDSLKTKVGLLVKPNQIKEKQP